MSGGHFDYVQYRIDDAANEIERQATWVGSDYQPVTLARFTEAAATLRLAAKMLHRVDWLLSDDDGEESFHKRWQAEIGEHHAR